MPPPNDPPEHLTTATTGPGRLAPSARRKDETEFVAALTTPAWVPPNVESPMQGGGGSGSGDRVPGADQALSRNHGARRAGPHGGGGPGVRLPGGERGGQDHHHADPAGPGRAEFRTRLAEREAGARPRRPRPGRRDDRGAGVLPVADRPPQPGSAGPVRRAAA